MNIHKRKGISVEKEAQLAQMQQILENALIKEGLIRPITTNEIAQRGTVVPGKKKLGDVEARWNYEIDLDAKTTE